MMCWRKWAAAASAAMVLALPVRAAAQRGADDSIPRGHVWPALGVHVGTPQKLSAALGVVVGEEWRSDGHEHSRNLALYAEPGLGGGRTTLAYLDHGYGSFGSGFAVGATVLRTWRDPWGLQDNVTYAGGDVIVWPILFVGPRIGVFRGISGVDRAKRWVVTFDLGLGL